MPPLLFLALTILLPLLALLLMRIRSGHAPLRTLAGEWKAHFASDDRFDLASRIAPQLPTAGAADVRVFNVIYAKNADRYHFIFTVEWTSGVLRWKKRLRQAGAVIDEKPAREKKLLLRLGNADASLREQYEQLHRSCRESQQADLA